MISGKFTVKIKNNKVKQVKQTLNTVIKKDVLVGVPQEKSSRPEEGEEITNAELMFIHTNGSALRNIPQRPVIEPALEDDRETISKIMKSALQALLNGDEQEYLKQLEIAGLEAQSASQDWFDNPKNGWPPNSPRTIRAKIKKGSTEPKPLIDTGELRKSIVYVIRDKEVN